MPDQQVTGAQPATWHTFATRRPLRGEWRYEHFGREQWVRVCFGKEPVAVRVTEDPAGPYYGWVNREGEITMVQPSRRQFEIQFPWGYQDNEACGLGRMVRLRVEEA